MILFKNLMENKLSFTDFLSINMMNNILLSSQMFRIIKILLFITLIYIIDLTLYLSYNNRQIYINQKIYNLRDENRSFELSYLNYSGNINHLNSFLKTNNFIKFNNSLISDLDNYKKSIDFLFLNFEKTKIENIFILIIIFPFLKENCTILYQIENKNELNLYRNTFKGIKNTKNLYTIYLNDLIHFIDNFKVFYFEWEIMPDNYLINNLRYIINNYYNETFLDIFDKSLNLNLKRYIEILRNNLLFNKFNDLMSK